MHCLFCKDKLTTTDKDRPHTGVAGGLALSEQKRQNMNIHKTLLLDAASGLSLAAGAQGKVYLETDFDNGIPSDFTLVDMDENPVSAPNYNNATVSDSWAANLADVKTNSAAFSFSSCQYDYPVENWMITPAVHIGSDAAILRWDARSMHYDLPESYKVMVSEGSSSTSDFKEVCRVDGEGYQWQTRAVSLAPYAGKDVYVAFVCTSDDKFILAIDNLFIGEPSDSRLVVKDTSRRFVGSSSPTAVAKGFIVNVGAPVGIESLECATDGGAISQPVGRELLTGDTLAYSFDIPVELNKVARYSLSAVTAGGTQGVYSDSLYCSYFPKTLLAEEGTGTWCNNCPAGTLQGNDMKERLGDDVLVVTVHTRDLLTCNDYNNGISRWISGIPAYIFNRDNTTLNVGPVLDDEQYRKALALEVPAYVDMKVERSADNPGMLALTTNTQFAVGYDNADGRYKLGFAVIEKTVEGTDTTIQANNSTLVSYDEYYYMPFYMPSKLTFYHNVPREGSTAFNGVEGSLPAVIEEGGSYEYAHTMALPAGFEDNDDLFVVAYVLNTLTGKVLNIAHVDVPPVSSGISAAEVSGDGSAIGVSVSGGEFHVDFPGSYEPYTVTVCGLDGTVLASVSGNGGSGTVNISCPVAQGRFCVLRAVQGDNVSVRKFFIK